ncbi:MAG: PucC family protein [Rubrimonas sp.]|uniref:PucC family protein n=1 Tax=Rubrimonas sp. TaxID=2036015 RepID=UPI002FDEAB5D
MILRQRDIKAAFDRLGPRFLPFADAATTELPLSRLLRLSLFQVSVGMAVVMLSGTLNRVMIIELGVPTWLVALMVSLPLLFAPARALIGFRSDNHRSVLGWRRVPYLWFGTLLQFGGFAIMPFALILLSGDQTTGPEWAGEAGAALAFLMVGAGMHTVQTAGLALATDIAPEESRPRVVALLYVMLMVGMVVASLAFGWLLTDFTSFLLIQVVQGVAAATLALNLVALWGQEPRRPDLTRFDRSTPRFRDAWAELTANGRATRLLVAVALGTAAFSMQDILLEPYGAEVLGLSVSATTALTALLAGGALCGFVLAARMLGEGHDAHLIAAFGAMAGLVGFSAVIFADPIGSAALFRMGVGVIGFGSGLFGVGALTAAMALAEGGRSGLALGAWGAVQATAAGLAIAAGGAIRDWTGGLAMSGALGEGLRHASTGYSIVYHIEIGLLFLTLVAIGPLVRHGTGRAGADQRKFGLAEFPT